MLCPLLGWCCVRFCLHCEHAWISHPKQINSYVPTFVRRRNNEPAHPLQRATRWMMMMMSLAVVDVVCVRCYVCTVWRACRGVREFFRALMEVCYRFCFADHPSTYNMCVYSIYMRCYLAVVLFVVWCTNINYVCHSVRTCTNAAERISNQNPYANMAL